MRTVRLKYEIVKRSQRKISAAEYPALKIANTDPGDVIESYKKLRPALASYGFVYDETKDTLQKKICEALLSNGLLEEFDTGIPKEKLERISKELELLSNGFGRLTAEIVKTGKTEKDCKLVRFIAANEEWPPSVLNATTIIDQCLALKKAVDTMNLEEPPKKKRVKSAVLKVETDETLITFIIKIEKPDYVFIVETNKEHAFGLVLLELEKIMPKILEHL